MTREYSRIFFKSHFGLEKPSKSQFLDLKTYIFIVLFHILDLNALKLLSHSLKMDLMLHIWQSPRGLQRKSLYTCMLCFVPIACCCGGAWDEEAVERSGTYAA